MQINDERLKEIKEMMNSRGYTEWVTNTDGVGNVITIEFIVDIKVFSPCRPVVSVYPAEDNRHEFRIHTVVNPGCIEVTTGKCESLFDEEHFRKMERFLLNAMYALRERGIV